LPARNWAGCRPNGMNMSTFCRAKTQYEEHPPGPLTFTTSFSSTPVL
jgi:hypothetical protein